MSAQSLGTDLAAMRRLNADAVLSLLWDEVEGLSAAELSHRGNLSRSTVNTLLADLARDGLIEVGATRTARVGRPARLYRINAARGAVVGIDLGPRSASGAVGDLRGAPLTKGASLTGDFRDGVTALDAVTRLVDRLMADTRYRVAEVQALAVSIPAVVDLQGRASRSMVAPKWVEHDLATKLRDAFPDCTVRVDNDTKLAAIAERDVGGITDEETAVLLRLDERISAAIVLNGRVARGAHGAAGEIGALRRLGWLDEYPLLAAVHGSARDGAVAEMVGMIVDGLSALVLTIDADAVVIVAATDELSQATADALREPLDERVLYTPEVRASLAGRSAPLQGALLAASGHVRAVTLSR